MDYEKKYKEALERASKLRVQNPFDTVSQMMEHVFPELKESEDERIRRELIKFIKKRNRSGCDYDYDKWIAWLEKQGEKKSVYKFEPKFHKGQWIVWQDKCYKVNYNGCGYELVDQNGLSISLEYRTIDENAHLWDVTKDAKPGDVLFHSDSASNGIFIFKELLKYEFGEKVICYCDYDSEDHFCLGENHTCCWADAKILQPATKEQRDRLFHKMEEEGYEWDANKKELKKIEQRSTDKDEPKEDNRPVTERIKTFDDARQELSTKAFSGDETAAILLADYESNADNIMHPQILAYMRLAIIAYALNEGWEPKFEKDEYRYYPWFYFYTKEEYDRLDDEKKERCVLRSGSSAYSNYSFVSCNASNDASYSGTYSGSRLAFRTRELAEYAGRRFIKEWADFVFKPE